MEPLDYALFRAHVYDEPNRLAAFLKGHLWVERCLNSYLDQALVRAEVLNIAKESFSRKVNLAEALGLVENYASALRAMNAVRNRIAHDLDHELARDDVKQMYAPLIAAVATTDPDLSQGLRMHAEEPLGEAISKWFELCLSTLQMRVLAMHAENAWHEDLSAALSSGPRAPLPSAPNKVNPADVWTNRTVSGGLD
ncbi:hypothetical protein [Cellulosimicrobium composti]|uniref:DUF4145 domain-containing protein n=1 Tax=Cellulosimicrobium composti TaxID=2672572 RepID=A0ABX0B7I4_9MICO|nr:hypothetical protein [Cellulosimicrobium composti]NDO88677.1 hypothetical protein [Cellulosimicrobium composti]